MGDTEQLSGTVNKENNRDGYVVIEIGSDKMKAFVRVYPPEGNGKPITPDSVRSILTENKVVYGLIEKNLNEAVCQTNPNNKVLVAEGKPPIDGKPAELIYYFSTERKIKLIENEDGKVDFYNLGFIQNVEKGQLLVEKTDPGFGEAGYTVCWDKIQPKPGKDITLPRGKNVLISADGKQLIAAVNGQVVIDTSGRVSVFPVYEVNGDLDLSIGNIDFIGSIIIKGNVGSGFTIKAGGDLDIYGSVDSSTLLAAGNITIKRGVQGRGKCFLKCTGELKAMFLENCDVEAGKDVIVQQAIMHCKILAGKKVILGEKKGLIVGGTVKAGDEVIVNELGAVFATPTDVEVGVNPYLRIELTDIAKKLADSAENLIKTKQALEILKKLEKQTGKLPAPKKELLGKLTRTQFILMQEIEKMKNRKTEIEQLISDLPKGRLVVHRTVHPGTKVTIGNASMHIRDEMHCVVFINEFASVKVLPC